MLGGWRSKEISGDSSSRYTVRVPAHPSQLGREGPGRGEPGSLRGPDSCREGTVQGERRHARPGGAISRGRPQGERHAPAACGQLCQRQGNCGHLRSAGGSGPGLRSPGWAFPARLLPRSQPAIRMARTIILAIAVLTVDHPPGEKRDGRNGEMKKARAWSLLRRRPRRRRRTGRDRGSSRCPMTSSPSSSRRVNVVRSGQGRRR